MAISIPDNAATARNRVHFFIVRIRKCGHAFRDRSVARIRSQDAVAYRPRHASAAGLLVPIPRRLLVDLPLPVDLRHLDGAAARLPAFLAVELEPRLVAVDAAALDAHFRRRHRLQEPELRLE